MQDMIMFYRKDMVVNNWEYFFCDERCMNDWLDVHMTQLMSFVGLKTKPQESPDRIVEKETQRLAGEYIYSYNYKVIEQKQLKMIQ
jgi:hypothetical protein